ncbi:hypothetical protein LXL04_015993 [Taraxacum kok-saghyz]
MEVNNELPEDLHFYDELDNDDGDFVYHTDSGVDQDSNTDSKVVEDIIMEPAFGEAPDFGSDSNTDYNSNSDSKQEMQLPLHPRPNRKRGMTRLPKLRTEYSRYDIFKVANESNGRKKSFISFTSHPTLFVSSISRPPLNQQKIGGRLLPPFHRRRPPLPTASPRLCSPPFRLCSMSVPPSPLLSVPLPPFPPPLLTPALFPPSMKLFEPMSRRRCCFPLLLLPVGDYCTGYVEMSFPVSFSKYRLQTFGPPLLLQRMGMLLRNFRRKVYAKYIKPNLGNPRKLARIPKRYRTLIKEQDAWDNFDLSQRTTEARKKSKYSHRMERGGYTTLIEKLVGNNVIAKGEMPARSLLWRKCREDKIGDIPDDNVKVMADQLMEHEKQIKDGNVTLEPGHTFMITPHFFMAYGHYIIK